MKKLDKISSIILSMFGIVLVVDIILEQVFNTGVIEENKNSLIC